MSKVLSSGKASFAMDVPWTLSETGPPKKKPLIVYLHGYKQNMYYFRKKCVDLLNISAYHLFLQGPYPVYDEKHQRKVEHWGRAWYLYDGEQEQFLASMEKTSVFIQALTDSLMAQYHINRFALLGYSMGGYLAGYFALSRPGYVDDLMVIGGRIKTEHFLDQSYNGMKALHLHGSRDRSVAPGRSKESCKQLSERGADVTFQSVDQGHKLNNVYTDAAKKWMLENDFIAANK